MSGDNFEIIDELGEGSYSTVYKVLRKSDNGIYAMKQVKFISLRQKEKENALNEVRILASIVHPNIIAYKEAFIAQQNLCIITEFAENGDLLQKIQAHKRTGTLIEENEIWRILIQSLRGLKALHDLKIFHRDIKSANIFLSQDGTVKLGDMNVSKVAKMGLLHTQTGTPYYASPEVWKDLPYDQKSDVWSLGCVIYEACALEPPFKANDMKNLFRKVVRGEYTTIPRAYSSELEAVIDSMLKVNPAFRPNCTQILKMDSVKNKLNTPCDNDYVNDLLKTIQMPSCFKSLDLKLPAPAYNRAESYKHFTEKKPKISKEQPVRLPRSVTRRTRKINIDLLRANSHKKKNLKRLKSVRGEINNMQSARIARSPRNIKNHK